MGARPIAFAVFVLVILLIGSVGTVRAQPASPSSMPSAGLAPAYVAPAAASPNLRGTRPVTGRLPSIPAAVVRSIEHGFPHGPRAVVGPMVEVNGSLDTLNAEVESAADPTTGYLYDLWIANAGIGFARSTNRGRSFEPAYLIPGSEDFVDPTNPNNVTSSWDPAIAVSSDGIVYAAFMDANYSSNPAGSPYVSVSFDHGASFSAARPVILPPDTSFSDRPFLAVAPDGTVYLTWNYAPDASLIQFLCAPGGSCSYASGDFNMVITRSRDHGRTWSHPNHVSPNYPRGGSLEGPIVIGRDGKIFVAFDAFPTAPDYTLSPGQEWFTSSRDGGRHWSKPFLLSGPYRVALQVWWIENTLAISESGVLYTAFDVQTARGDIGFVRYSKDDGVTWSPLIRATPDVDNAAHIMQLAPGPRGDAYVAWLSNNTTNGAWAVYIASLSTKHGTVSPPVLVSPLLGDPNWWPGDTIGMAYLGHGTVSVSWGSQIDPLGQNDGIFNVIVRHLRG